MNGNKFLYIGLGMAAGGIVGYLIADYLVYAIRQAEFEKEVAGFLPDDDPEGVVVTLVTKNEEDGKKVPYNEIMKAELKDLAKPYETETGPYIVSMEDWATFNPGYEKAMVTYYEVDGVYANEQEDSIESPQNLFGPNIHLHFGEESDDPDVVYVCNPPEETLFEIIRLHESYKEQVLGEVKPAPKKKRGPGRPRKKKPAAPDKDKVESNGKDSDNAAE